MYGPRAKVSIDNSIVVSESHKKCLVGAAGSKWLDLDGKGTRRLPPGPVRDGFNKSRVHRGVVINQT